MNEAEIQRQKEIKEAEELLFTGPQPLGVAKGLFLGRVRRGLGDAVSADPGGRTGGARQITRRKFARFSMSISIPRRSIGMRTSRAM